MISGLYTAASGMIAQQAKQDILANNLANADTPGFKADLLTVDASADSPNTLSDFGSPATTVRPGRSGLFPFPSFSSRSLCWSIRHG